MKPVSLALVGCGAITASGHLPAALRSPLVEVSALVDVNLVNARALAKDFAVDAIVTDNLESVLDQVEGVVISTPNHSHVTIAEMVLKRGIPTLIEKPITTTYDDAVRLCELADRTKTFIAVAYRSRFWPAVRMLRRLLETDFLGRVLSFTYTFGARSTWAAVSGFSVNRQMAGGGALIDAHVIDKILYWFGEPVDFTYWDDSHGGVEATCKAILTFNGPHGNFNGSLFLSRTLDLKNKLEVETDRYLCELSESPTARLNLRHRDRLDVQLEAQDVRPSSQGDHDDRTDFQAQLEEFASNVRCRGPITIDGRFAARSVKLIEAMYRARQPLPEPWLLRSTEMEKASVE